MRKPEFKAGDYIIVDGSSTPDIILVVVENKEDGVFHYATEALNQSGRTFSDYMPLLSVSYDVIGPTIAGEKLLVWTHEMHVKGFTFTEEQILECAIRECKKEIGI